LPGFPALWCHAYPPVFYNYHDWNAQLIFGEKLGKAVYLQ